MKTTLNTNTYTITITEITPDYDAPENLEISFDATFTPAHLRSTEYFTDLPAEFADQYSDIVDYADNEPYITYEFNVAQRHSNGLYLIIKHDASGDCIDDYESAVYAYGQPVIDFIADACRLLKIPFFPN